MQKADFPSSVQTALGQIKETGLKTCLTTRKPFLIETNKNRKSWVFVKVSQ